MLMTGIEFSPDNVIFCMETELPDYTRGTCSVYHASTGEFSSSGPTFTSGIHHESGSYGMIGGSLFMVGGRTLINGTFTVNNKVSRLDSVSEDFVLTGYTDIATNEASLFVTISDTEALLICGWFYTPYVPVPRATRIVRKLDTTASEPSSLIQVSSTNLLRQFHSGAKYVKDDGSEHVLIVGGYTTYAFIKETESYDIAADTWSFVPEWDLLENQ